MVKHAFIQQVIELTGNSSLANELWQEIEAAYTEPSRHFHNLFHLEHLVKELMPVKDKIEDWQTLFFSLCYHDVVYDVVQNAVLNNNEKRSAAFAERHLEQMAYPAEKIERCRRQILATQKHSFTNDNDTDHFTDADLSILGQSWSVYAEYKDNIRNEFQLYPNAIYNAGRRKVLGYFLSLEPLYKTDHFYRLYERQAKDNISKELETLNR